MIPFLAAILGTLSGLRRRCPTCEKEQVVPRSQRRQPVICKACGGEIPAPRPAGVA